KTTKSRCRAGASAANLRSGNRRGLPSNLEVDNITERTASLLQLFNDSTLQRSSVWRRRRRKWSRSNARSGSFSIRNQPLKHNSVNNSLTEKILRQHKNKSLTLIPLRLAETAGRIRLTVP